MSSIKIPENELSNLLGVFPLSKYFMVSTSELWYKDKHADVRWVLEICLTRIVRTYNGISSFFSPCLVLRGTLQISEFRIKQQNWNTIFPGTQCPVKPTIAMAYTPQNRALVGILSSQLQRWLAGGASSLVGNSRVTADAMEIWQQYVKRIIFHCDEGIQEDGNEPSPWSLTENGALKWYAWILIFHSWISTIDPVMAQGLSHWLLLVQLWVEPNPHTLRRYHWNEQKNQLAIDLNGRNFEAPPWDFNGPPVDQLAEDLL